MFSGLGNTHLVFINGYSDGGISAFGLYLYICIYINTPPQSGSIGVRLYGGESTRLIPFWKAGLGRGLVKMSAGFSSDGQ